MSDAVDHPAHYTAHPSGIEAVDICEHLSFNLGNAVKYCWRAGLKSPNALEDLKKSAWYLRREATRRADALEKLLATMGRVSETDEGILGILLSLLVRAGDEEAAFLDDALVVVERDIARLEKDAT